MITTQSTPKFSLLSMLEWFSAPKLKPLPTPPETYRIVKAPSGWFEARGPDEALAYSGLGPVQVLAAPYLMP